MADRTMSCPRCGAAMNRHAEKLSWTNEDEPGEIDPAFGGVIEAQFACPVCGASAARAEPPPADA